MKNARAASRTTATAMGIPTSIPVFELWLWFVGWGEGELVDVLDVVVEICVGVATEVWLVDCTEVPRLEGNEEADVSVAPEEMEDVKVVLDDSEELVVVD